MARHPIIEPMDGPLPVIGVAQPGKKRRRFLPGSFAASAPGSFRVVAQDDKKRSRHVIFEPMDGPVVIGGATLPKKGRRGRITIEGWLTPEDD
jgi:hypothetical protein